MIRLIISALVCCTAILGAAGTPDPVKADLQPTPDLKDEKYGDNAMHVFDFWKAKSDAPTPLVIFIHGGGFSGGDKTKLGVKGSGQGGSLIQACLDAGISVASINYRLSGEVKFPASFQDSARALQYMRAKAKDLNINPMKVGLWGNSAGAGMSLWLAFHDDLADPKNEDPILHESTRVQCIVERIGQCSYDPRWIKEHVGGLSWEQQALAQLFRVMSFYKDKTTLLTASEAFPLYEEASAINFLTKDDPPVAMRYDLNDEPEETWNEKRGSLQPGIHSKKFGEFLKVEMDKLGIPCEYATEDAESQVAWYVKYLK